MKIFDLIFSKAIDRRISVYQNDLITKHIAEVENIYNQMRGWRHDYHNHIQTLKAYRAFSLNDKVDEYLNSLDSDLTSVDTLIKSGNVMIDAILNSKISLAKAQSININAKAIIPKSLSIAEIDLCVIIGNLLDNAIEACMNVNLEDVRFIRVYMDLKKDNLYITVTNSCGAVIKRNGRFISNKGMNHGFGLLRVDNMVNKYGGYIKRSSEEDAFTCEVLIPL